MGVVFMYWCAAWWWLVLHVLSEWCGYPQVFVFYRRKVLDIVGTCCYTVSINKDSERIDNTMSQILTILPLQEQILLEGNGHNYLFKFDEVSTYLMDTRGFSRADVEEYSTVGLVEAYISDPYEVEALAEYSNK